MIKHSPCFACTCTIVYCMCMQSMVGCEAWSGCDRLQNVNVLVLILCVCVCVCELQIRST